MRVPDKRLWFLDRTWWGFWQWLLGVSVLAASSVGFLGRYWWMFDLTNHFRVQWAAVAAHDGRNSLSKLTDWSSFHGPRRAFRGFVGWCCRLFGVRFLAVERIRVLCRVRNCPTDAQLVNGVLVGS